MTDEPTEPKPAEPNDPPKPAETPPEPTPPAPPEPTASEDMISKANAAAARLEDANKETARLNAETTALKVEKTLGGKAEAGSQPPKEDTPEEYAKKVMANEIETTE